MKRLFLLLLPALLLLAVLSLFVGDGPLNLARALAQDGVDRAILVDLRLPRLMLALMTGASLGACGAALQGLVRNPLAEPGLIGVTGGASLGAMIVFHFGLAALMPLALPLGGMLGAGLAVAVCLALARRGAGTLGLILAGIAVSALTGALGVLVLNLAPSPFAAYEILYWTMGSVADRSWREVLLAAPFVVTGLAIVLSRAPALRLLSMGEAMGVSLGVDLSRLRLSLAWGIAAAVGAVTSVTGGIGFVGLIAPHLLRPFLAQDPARLVPASAVAGAAIVLAADILTRLIPSQGPALQLGVVTALAGSPIFFWVLLRGGGTRR